MSFDPPLSSSSLSSSELAESALVNLRKSLISQRHTQTPRTAKLPESRVKSTLEDRLRRATNNALSGHTRSTSGTATGTITRPLSPRLHHLPDSCPNSPKLEATNELPVLIIKETYNYTPGPTISVTALETKEISELNAVVSNPSSSPPVQVDVPQEKLKQLEQRFADISSSFTKLQEEKMAIENVVQEFSALQAPLDIHSLRDYFLNEERKVSTLKDEIKFLNNKFECEEERFGRLNESLSLEHASQRDQIERLKIQVSECEALVAAEEDLKSKLEGNEAFYRIEMDRLKDDIEHANFLAKDEEEKRVKAVSLLKSVRQKLVKTEKDKEDAWKEITQLREKDRAEKVLAEEERTRLRAEIEAITREKDNALRESQADFEREVVDLKDCFEKDTSIQRQQFELDAATTKGIFEHDLELKTSQISSLDVSLRNLTLEKDALFDNLQLRQGELESARSHLESLQSHNTELQHQLRELDDRYTFFREEYVVAQQERQTQQESSPVSDEVTNLLSVTEARYKAKLSDLKKLFEQSENERTKDDIIWSRKLRDKCLEVDQLKLITSTMTVVREQHDTVLDDLNSRISGVESERRSLQERVLEQQKALLEFKDTERIRNAQELELDQKIGAFQQQLNEASRQEARLRLTNKTLREELRKVQSSAALLERQRNPGARNWTSSLNEIDQDNSHVATTLNRSDSHSTKDSPQGELMSTVSDEVNLAYLRNVILQFLEHSEMRPTLVKVLSTMLRFTPQETRRLVSKI